MTGTRTFNIIRHLIALTAVTATAAVAIPAGAAGDQGPFTLKAQAAPLAVELSDTGAPVIPGGQVLYVTPALTRADLDNVDNSAAFAAGPYPGDTPIHLMGTLNAVGPAPILPEYPFLVRSQSPGQPTDKKANGPHTLSAESTDNASKATAHFGLAQGNPGILSATSSSSVSHLPASGALTALANSSLDGFSLGEQLTIGHVSGQAEIKRVNGQLTKASSFSIGSLSVMGQIVGLTDKGLVPVSKTNPGTDMKALSDALAQAGITLALVPAKETANSIDSAGLAVGFLRDVPNHGLMRVTVFFGRVQATVDAQAAG